MMAGAWRRDRNRNCPDDRVRIAQALNVVRTPKLDRTHTNPDGDNRQTFAAWPLRGWAFGMAVAPNSQQSCGNMRVAAVPPGERRIAIQTCTKKAAH
jgi:hypothetical protein